MFTHATGSDPVVSWTDSSRTLEIEFQPYVSSVRSIVDAINDAGVPVQAETVKEAVDSSITSPAASGTGALPGFDLPDGHAIITDNAATMPLATTGVIELSGYDNDFIVTEDGWGADFTLQFVHTAEPVPSVSWNAGVLEIEFQRGVTTAKQLVDAIEGSAAPLSATLVGDLPMKVELTAADSNNGEGVIERDDLNVAVTYATSGGDVAIQSTIGIIDPVGENNAFEIMAIDPGADKDGILVTFYESDTASAHWNNDTETLTVRYVPGTGGTMAWDSVGSNGLVNLINGIADPTFPLQATLVDPEPNDGSAIVSDTDLVDETAAKVEGAVADTDYATTGVFSLGGADNDFEILASVPGPTQNGIGIVFVHRDTGDANVSAVWNPAAGPQRRTHCHFRSQ